MIYITKRYDSLCETSYINNVWEVKCDNVEELYKDFLAEKAKELDIVINEHWNNIMNRENHHPHLTEEEYKLKVKAWSKVLRQWNIDKFIGDILRGKKLKYKEII